ncbi:CAP domain-containing protein [Clostridium perfringens]|uniref:CAP domain-containing protein n=1 Tax=Clostridium perfringens TaxID=1502 RepID=UPI0024BD53A8|nr:CAP domain-containing protein [Clostridium perfringens]
MNKRIRAIIEFVKVHKKETIGLGVALGVAVIGVGGYAINKHYANKTAETNNIALAEKKEDSSLELENNESDPSEEATETENDIVVEESEDGTLVVKDKEGNTIADSSKGDDITKVIAEKKEAGSNVNIKDKDGKTEKVDKIEGGSITVTGGGTVTIKPPVVADATKPTNKPSNNNSNAGGNTESNSRPQENNNSNNNPTPPAQNKPVEQPSVDNNKPQQPVQKPVETPKPQPPVEKPTEKPQEPVKPEKPKRTWEYQGAMSQELWSLFNQYRQENGLNALNWSGKYNGWVKQHTEEMAQKETSFHKTYPEGGQVVYDGNAYTTASAILQGFKNSPAHNRNLLDDELTEGACAVYKDSNGQFYVAIGFDY